MATTRVFPVIMSGGSGTRLWPLSTGACPKQFHALGAPRSMIAETALRLRDRRDTLEFLDPIVIAGEALEAALAYVTAVLDPDHPGYAGPHFSLEPVPTAPRSVRGHIPLIVGGIGPERTPRLAGTYAHEYNCYPAPPDEFRSRVRIAHDAAITAGRDPDELLISSSGNVIAAETEAGYREALGRAAADGEITVEELEAHMNRRNTPRGTFEQVRGHLDDLAAAGMRRFYLQRGPDIDHGADTALIEALTA